MARELRRELAAIREEFPPRTRGRSAPKAPLTYRGTRRAARAQPAVPAPRASPPLAALSPPPLPRLPGPLALRSAEYVVEPTHLTRRRRLHCRPREWLPDFPRPGAFLSKSFIFSFLFLFQKCLKFLSVAWQWQASLKTAARFADFSFVLKNGVTKAHVEIF